MTGMPAFQNTLSDTERWRVTMLLAHADRVPAGVPGEPNSLTDSSDTMTIGRMSFTEHSCSPTSTWDRTSEASSNSSTAKHGEHGEAIDLRAGSA
jgi:hypothetical protein